MKLMAISAALLLAALPAAASQQRPEPRQITFHGCVAAGERAGTYHIAPVTHLVEPELGRVPEFAHGRQVFFWLTDDRDVKKHIGKMVEIRGEFGKMEESELEIKAGRHRDGGLIVEFEGPGRDVRASQGASGAVVGTGGRNNTEKDDTKTYLIRVAVKSVTATGNCQ